jgi:molybdenum cofactor synthesis domain-containing protein
MRTVAVLIVGDEILAGEVRDENGPFLLERLATVGARVQRIAVCPDREDDVVLELLRLRALADAVLVCGGIGPTHDDVTRAALARGLGVPLARHAEAEQRLRGFYGPGITASDLEMALLPQGSRLVLGPTTGTYGFALAGVYGLPGVPFLLRDLTEAILPELDGAPLHKVELRTDLREGEIAPHLTAAQRDAGEMAIGSYPVCLDGCWMVRVVIRGPDLGRVQALEQRLRSDLARVARAPS